MHLRASAIVCASRAHGETAGIVRLLTADHGMIAGYVAGARGREMRPVLVPGNVVEAELRAKSDNQ
jgi:DNA repair protein RecO (recombination protein O)